MSRINGHFWILYSGYAGLHVIAIEHGKFVFYDIEKCHRTAFELSFVEKEYEDKFGHHYHSTLEDAYKAFKKNPYVEKYGCKGKKKDYISKSKYQNVRFSTIKKKLSLITLGI